MASRVSDEPLDSSLEVFDASASAPSVGSHHEGGHSGSMLSLCSMPPSPPVQSINHSNDGSRLIISHIECTNFKSFAGTQVLGPFHQSLTAIVGPNGSGKSNVVDALMFVFGYRAQKIRSKRVSALIHNLDPDQNIRSCTVKVFFKKIIDGGSDVPDSKFVVSRTAFNDNTSFYSIDDHRLPFSEIEVMLRLHGVDLGHPRFLILQGEVEQIVFMKPKALSESDHGMLELLEDLIGSSKFKPDIEILQNLVEDLDAQRAERLVRLNLAKKDLAKLEKPNEQAVAHLRQLNYIAQKTDLLCQLRIFLAETKVANTMEKQKVFLKSKSDVTERLKKATEQREQQDAAAQEASAELDLVSKEREAAQQLFSKADQDSAKLTEDFKLARVKLKKLKQLSADEKQNYSSLLQVPEDNKKKIDDCVNQKTTLEIQLAAEQKMFDKALESANVDTKELQGKKNQLEAELNSSQQDENEKEAKYRVAKNEIDLMKSAELQETVKLDQLKQRALAAKNQSRAKEAELKEHTEKIPELQQTIEQSEKESEVLNRDYETSAKKVNVLRAETRTKQSSSKQGGGVLASLLSQKATGAIEGIYGRLGDLGAVDKKYDVAISTAAGSALDRIVVDVPETAVACIEFLRAKDIGQGNFLALDRTKGFEAAARNKYRGPEGAPRLVDLVQVQDENLRTAFYRYLKDTLVAEDIEQANRIAFGARRYRVVTLDGSLIELSGAMTGGGETKLSGKMGAQVVARVSEADLRLKEASLAAEETNLASLAGRKREAEVRLSEARRESAQRSRAAEKLKLDLNNLRDERTMLKAQMANQQNVVDDSKPDAGLLGQKEAALEGLLRDLEAAKKVSSELRENVTQLRIKIQDVKTTLTKSVQDKLDNTSGELDLVRQEITRLQVGIKSSVRDLKKSEDKLESYQAEILELQKKMQDLIAEYQPLTEAKLRLQSDLNKLEKRETELDDKLKASQEEIKVLTEKENELKGQHFDFVQTVEKFNSAIEENTMSANRWKRERNRIRLEFIPGEEEPEELSLTSVDVLRTIDHDELEAEVRALKAGVAATQADWNVIKEYRRKKFEYLDRQEELNSITQDRDNKWKLLEDLKQKRLGIFMEGFGMVSSKLREVYRALTFGGDAELELVDRLDPFTEGIILTVRPPQKTWKNLSNLSGGEKTLASLSLVFALHDYKPTPFYFMDEIDASLDFKNASVVANFIHERTRNAQFIIVSLRSNMFEKADRLVGIYKTYNATKSVTIDPAKVS